MTEVSPHRQQTAWDRPGPHVAVCTRGKVCATPCTDWTADATLSLACLTRLAASVSSNAPLWTEDLESRQDDYAYPTCCLHQTDILRSARSSSYSRTVYPSTNNEPSIKKNIHRTQQAGHAYPAPPCRCGHHAQPNERQPTVAKSAADWIPYLIFSKLYCVHVGIQRPPRDKASHTPSFPATRQHSNDPNTVSCSHARRIIT